MSNEELKKQIYRLDEIEAELRSQEMKVRSIRLILMKHAEMTDAERATVGK